MLTSTYTLVALSVEQTTVRAALQSLLDEGLTNRFDEDWWRNPAAGPWIVGELMAEGQRESAGEIAQRTAGVDISFAPLTRKIESLLGA